MEQGTVTSLIEEKGSVKGVKYKNKDGKDVKSFAPLTIVCDGCFSNLRKNLCIPQVLCNDLCVRFLQSRRRKLHLFSSIFFVSFAVKHPVPLCWYGLEPGERKASTSESRTRDFG